MYSEIGELQLIEKQFLSFQEYNWVTEYQKLDKYPCTLISSIQCIIWAEETVFPLQSFK